MRALMAQSPARRTSLYPKHRATVSQLCDTDKVAISRLRRAEIKDNYALVQGHLPIKKPTTEPNYRFVFLDALALR